MKVVWMLLDNIEAYSKTTTSIQGVLCDAKRAMLKGDLHEAKKLVRLAAIIARGLCGTIDKC